MLWSDVAGMAHDGPDPAIIPWIERLSPVSLENGIMTVSTRQNWTAKKIMGEFKPLIEELLHEITLEPIALNVVVDSPTFHVEPSANPVPASVATPAVIAPTSAPAPSAASPAAGPLTSKAAVSAPEPAYQPTPQPREAPQFRPPNAPRRRPLWEPQTGRDLPVRQAARRRQPMRPG